MSKSLGRTEARKSDREEGRVKDGDVSRALHLVDQAYTAPKRGTGPQLRDRNRVATTSAVELVPPRARRNTSTEASLSETTQHLGSCQTTTRRTTKRTQGTLSRTTDRVRRSHPTQYLHRMIDGSVREYCSSIYK